MRKPILWVSNRLLDISAFFLFIMMIHISLDVILKYTINHPIKGTIETVSFYYMVLSVFLPISFVELSRQSISVDIFYNMMSRNLKLACAALAFLVCATVYGGLAWMTFGDAMRSLARNEIAMGENYIPIWPSRFVLPVSFLTGALVCLWYLLGLLFSARLRKEIMSPEQSVGDA